MKPLMKENPAGYSVPVLDHSICSDKTLKDGLRIVKYEAKKYRNGFSAFDGYVSFIMWAVYNKDQWYHAKTRREALNEAREAI